LPEVDLFAPGGIVVEERLEALTEAWKSFVVEFPTFPKVTNRGREETPRILFLCSTKELNPMQLCMSLFGHQIQVENVKYGQDSQNLAGTRFIFLYTAETPSSIREVLDYYQEKVNTPVLVAQRSNVQQTAQHVVEFLARSAVVEGRTAGGWTTPVQDSSLLVGPDQETIFQDPLPAITMVSSKGQRVTAKTDLADFRAEYACRFVLAHYHENINRDRMAEKVNLSPGYFSNLFRSEVGMSFSDYLIQVRIEKAKQLLRRFDLSVEAISKKCGFNSLAHFSRTFKDRCGVSPLKFRKNPHQGT
jgi:AraC-like DNA-binding protein